MEARDKKILIQSVSTVFIIVVLFNVYSSITVSKIGIPGLIDIEFNPGSGTAGDVEKTDEGIVPKADEDSLGIIENTGRHNNREHVYRPVQPSVINLSSAWFGADGSEYEITHDGSMVYFTKLQPRWVGRYQNKQIIFEYETVFGTLGTATLTLSQDNRILSGRANDLNSGAITQLYLTKE